MSQREVLAQQTYVPEDARDVAEVHSFLAAHEAARGEGVPRRFLLVGGAEHEQVEIPQQVYEVLCQVVEAMSAGKAVTVAPHSTSLTTQQAADLLGVSPDGCETDRFRGDPGHARWQQKEGPPDGCACVPREAPAAPVRHARGDRCGHRRG